MLGLINPTPQGSHGTQCSRDGAPISAQRENSATPATRREHSPGPPPKVPWGDHDIYVYKGQNLSTTGLIRARGQEPRDGSHQKCLRQIVLEEAKSEYGRNLSTRPGGDVLEINENRGDEAREKVRVHDWHGLK